MEKNEINKKEFIADIEQHASETLSRSQEGFTYVAAEQGGFEPVKLNDKGEVQENSSAIPDLLDMAQLTGGLRQALFDNSQRMALTDHSTLSPTEVVINHQQDFVAELLGEIPTLVPQLAQTVAKATIAQEVLHNTSLPQLEGLPNNLQTWKETLETIATTLCQTEGELGIYHTLVSQAIEQLRQPSPQSLAETASHHQESYLDHLKRLVKNPRAVGLLANYLQPQHGEQLAEGLIDEYLQTAFTLNTVRVLDRLERPLTASSACRKLINVLNERESDPQMADFIAQHAITDKFTALQEQIHGIASTYSLPDDQKKEQIKQLEEQFEQSLRPLILSELVAEIGEKEQLDMVATRRQIEAIFQQAKTIHESEMNEAARSEQLVSLDKDLTQLLIPLGNKVERVFPHKNNTNLSSVLQNENAICAGKVNVLLAVSRYLGLNSRANTVEEILDGDTSGHVCFETDLPSGRKLVIDANFSNPKLLQHKTAAELKERALKTHPTDTPAEIETHLKYLQLSIKNSHSIDPDSRILLYTAEKTEKTLALGDTTQQLKDSENLTVRINPYTGVKEVWKTSVPYPHRITAPDKDGYLYINSSFTNNNTISISERDKQAALYLLRRHIEMNPYDARPYYELARHIPPKEGLPILEQLRSEKADLYWNEVSLQHAVILTENNRLDEAVELYSEIKQHNSQLAYTHIHELSRALREQARKNTHEADRYLTQARVLIDGARTGNAELFYSQYSNVLEHSLLYPKQHLKEIAVLEDYQHVNQTAFWQTDTGSLPADDLFESYMMVEAENPQYRQKAEELMLQMKLHNPQFYASHLHKYVDSLYLLSQDKQPEKARGLLEALKTDDPTAFYQSEENIATLARIYTDSDDDETAKALYEQTLQNNPELFWNAEYFTPFTKLAQLYTASNQRDKAISLYERGKDECSFFWGNTFRAPYSALANLYAEQGRLQEAITLCTQAESNDPTFYSPDYSDRGYLLLAYLYNQTDQLSPARELFERAASTDKKFWNSSIENPHVFHYISLLEKHGLFDQALPLYTRVKQENDDILHTDYYTICEAYDNLGESERAEQTRNELITAYEQLKETKPDEYYPQALKLAHIYMGGKQIDKAIEVLENARDNYSLFPLRGLITLLELSQQTGDQQKITTSYQAIVSRFEAFEMNDMANHFREQAQLNGIVIP